MTQEDKELLLRDLSARLPYEVMVDYDGYDHVLDSVVADGTVHVINIIDNVCDISEVKPYLRPMSSMTKEEIETYRAITKSILKNSVTDNVSTLYNFLNSKHLDYNGLIPKGLALPAPEGMYYETKEEKK